jgi:nucleoside-diphosphate-sugar epimerase
MAQRSKVLVTGAGGFIGHHLATYLKSLGYWVRGVDIHYPECTHIDTDEFCLLDLRRWENCLRATEGIDAVYVLAADMGGMGFISANHASILHNNALINVHTLEAARTNHVQRYLYTSSACVYPEYRQLEADVTPLKEDAYPAEPQDAYGWEKLMAEHLCCYNHKVATAKLIGNPEVDIWGDGEQTRSFCYIDDCVTGLYKLLCSDYTAPLNPGQDRLVSINQLADRIAEIVGFPIIKRHIPGPQGMRGRNSDNTRLRQVLGWEPSISLEEGLAATYAWIEGLVEKTALVEMV